MDSTLDGIGNQWMPKWCGMGSSKDACEDVHWQHKFSYKKNLKWSILGMLRHWATTKFATSEPTVGTNPYPDVASWNKISIIKTQLWQSEVQHKTSNS